MKVGGRPLFDGLLVLNGWRPRMSSNVGFIVLVRRLGFWVIVCLLGFSVVVLVRLTGPPELVLLGLVVLVRITGPPMLVLLLVVVEVENGVVFSRIIWFSQLAWLGQLQVLMAASKCRSALQANSIAAKRRRKKLQYKTTSIWRKLVLIF